MNTKKKASAEDWADRLLAPKVPRTDVGDLYEPASYLRSFSDSSCFTILTRIDPHKDYKDKSNCEQFSFETIALRDGIDFVREVYADRDIWISQAEFYIKCRQRRFVKSIGTLFSDIDTYSSEAMSVIAMTPEEQLAVLLQWCDNEALPKPSKVIFSGRGLQAKWLLDRDLPRAALKRWDHAQTMIYRRLQELGADAKAKDVCRVLRVVGSINQKSGEVVREIYSSNERYNFEKLYEHLVTTERDFCKLSIDEDGNVSRVLESKYESHQTPEVRPWIEYKKRDLPSNVIGLRKVSASKLSSDRYEDLKTLVRLRWSNGLIPSGQRDVFVFLASVFLCQAHVDQNRIDDELKRFCDKYVPSWSEQDRLNSISASIKRLQKSIKGLTVPDSKNNQVDPRYRFKNETLQSVEWLNITSDEEGHLKTIVSREEVRRRGALRAKAHRHSRGALEREAYLQEKKKKRETALQLRSQGRTWEEIAQQLSYKNAESARRSCNQSSLSTTEQPNSPNAARATTYIRTQKLRSEEEIATSSLSTTEQPNSPNAARATTYIRTQKLRSENCGHGEATQRSVVPATMLPPASRRAA